MAENDGKQPQVDPARAMASKNKPSQPVEGGDTSKIKPKMQPLEGVVANKVKPPLSKRLRQAFTNDDARSVGDYLLFEVAVPAIKATIFDLIQGGASRALFGSGISARQTQARPGQVNYNTISRQQIGGTPIGAVQPQLSARDRATFNFDGIIFPNRVGAEAALTKMLETVNQYGVFAVADLYDLVNIAGTFADDKWGWFNLDGADIVPVRNGFVLDLPPVQPIR